MILQFSKCLDEKKWDSFYKARNLDHVTLLTEFTLFVYILKVTICSYFLTSNLRLAVHIKVVLIKKWNVITWCSNTLFYKNQLFLTEAQLFLFLKSILTSFLPWPPPLNYVFKMLLVISSLRFPDRFASSMNIFQNTNIKSEAGCSYKKKSVIQGGQGWKLVKIEFKNKNNWASAKNNWFL